MTACDVLKFHTTGNDKEELISIMKTYSFEEEPEQPAQKKRKVKRTVSETALQQEMIADDEVPPLPPPLQLPSLASARPPSSNNSSTATFSSSSSSSGPLNNVNSSSKNSNNSSSELFTSDNSSSGPLSNNSSTIPVSNNSSSSSYSGPLNHVNSSLRQFSGDSYSEPFNGNNSSGPLSSNNSYTTLLNSTSSSTWSYNNANNYSRQFSGNSYSEPFNGNNSSGPLSSNNSYTTLFNSNSSSTGPCNNYSRQFSGDNGSSGPLNNSTTPHVHFSAGGNDFSSYPPSYYGTDQYNPHFTATWPPSAMAEIKQFIHAELFKVEERVRQLEEASAGTSNASNFRDEGNSVLPPALHSLTREQKLTIDMILSSKGSWTVVMRKILLVVFGQATLAESCAVGRTNANSQPLNTQKLTAVKGIDMHVAINLYYIHFHAELMFKSFPGEKISEGAMNVIVNSACSGARRAQKH